MSLLNFLEIAMVSLWRNRMRSFLTILGIIIGVGAVIAIVAVGNGAKKQVENQINSLGSNVIMIMPGQVTQGGIRQYGGQTNFNERDMEVIRRNCPAVSSISPQVRTTAQAKSATLNWDTAIYGVSADYFDIRNWPVVSGRLFTPQEVSQALPVCVIGQVVAQNLFGEADPVGQIIQINKVPFLVIGMLDKKGGGGFGGDQDDAVLAPYTVVMRRITGSIYFNNFLVSAVAADQIAEASQEISAALRESHHLASWQPDDFNLRSQDEFRQTAEQTSKVLILFLGSVAGISLVVGGIGVMNIMLVSVTERTREIGVRRAVGATRGNILLQFLIEAVVLCFIGGVIGIFLGIGASYLISKFMNWPVSVSSGSVFLAFGFSALIGIFFGYYPARTAARMDPIEALRYQ